MALQLKHLHLSSADPEIQSQILLVVIPRLKCTCSKYINPFFPNSAILKNFFQAVKCDIQAKYVTIQQVVLVYVCSYWLFWQTSVFLGKTMVLLCMFLNLVLFISYIFLKGYKTFKTSTLVTFLCQEQRSLPKFLSFMKVVF